ncbi:PH domain-containing protein [Pedobacter ghigonis]|uniref:hypothetical protein n=1 Tax=Pedobacter ghigonis TaxID=2730403 RepID=UPI001589E984|nr:hypothetical protein [Pedobacter ghigonis]
MNRNELTKITYSACYTVNGIKYNKTPISGKFHKWADDPIYENEKWFARTVGIVEDENGKVFKAPCDAICFLDV